MLRVENLCVPGRVEGVSLTVRKGTLHALVGPNGAGKSTVLQAVLGLVPYSGAVTCAATGRIGVVPQRFEQPHVLPMSVVELLAASRTGRPVCLGVGAPLRARIEAMLKAAGIPGVAHQLVSELSGGELRRVLVANALEPEPELLLLDEPEAGLDEASLGWLEETLRSLKARGVTALLVSHDAARVARLADDVTRLVGGRRA